MTAFIVIAAVMTVGALAWVLPPLLRRRAQTGGVESPQSNLAVLRDQVAELDADLANGTIVPEQHASARAELERRVLEEGDTGAKIAGGPPMSTRWLAALLGMLIP